MSVDTQTAPARADRTPPHDVDAEQSVLGGMLMSKDAVSDAVEILRPGDFYRPAHTTIFETISGMYADGEPADPVTVAANLAETGTLARIGGAGYLHTLMSAVPTAASTGFYARIVAERATLRALIEAGTRIVQLGYQPDGDVDRAVDQAQQSIYDLTSGNRDGSDPTQLQDLLQPTLDEIEAASTADATRGIPTGFIDLDRLTNGFHPGQLIIVGARPGLGKSTAGLDFTRASAIKHGHPAAIFSLEMSKVEIVMRLLSAESRVPLNLLRSGHLDDTHWTSLARRMGEIADAPIFIDDTPNMTLMQIRAKARRLKQRHSLKMIVVDYLQLMTSPKRVESRQQEVAEISRGLKLLAKEIEVPVIAMSQLNRGVEGRQDKRPNLSDLRESGGLEQDADMVILLHRDDYYDKESARSGEADFIVAKHRNGPTDTITVAAQLHLSRFVDMSILSPT